MTSLWSIAAAIFFSAFVAEAPIVLTATCMPCKVARVTTPNVPRPNSRLIDKSLALTSQRVARFLVGGEGGETSFVGGGVAMFFFFINE